MPMERESGCCVNSLVWLSSLMPNEQGLTDRILEDLTPFFRRIELPFLFHKVNPATELYAMLDNVATYAQNGTKPFLQLDMHGSKDGLEIAATNEIAPWATVVSKLQAINIASRGNLCVVAGVCFAFHAIKQVHIFEACPVYLLIAPEDIVTAGYLQDNMVGFYKDVFSCGDIAGAHEKHLSSSFRVFHCEKFLAIALCKYISQSCKGKGGAERRERLLTEILLDGQQRTPENVGAELLRGDHFRAI